MTNIDKLKVIVNRLTVEDLEHYTILQLVQKLVLKINELSDSNNEIVDTLLELLKGGLTEEVVEVLTKWLNDGTLGDIITEDVLVNINQRIGRLSVKDFGAKGDGVTDDSEAINACLEEAIETGQVCFFPRGTYMVARNWSFDNSHEVMIEGENYLNTNILLKEGIRLNKYYLFDFENCDKFTCSNLTSNLGFQVISSETYFKGETAWKLKLRKKDFVIKDCIVKGDYVQQGYQIALASPCPDSYDRYSSPEYQQYPIEITNGSGYNAININNFATNEDGSIATPPDNSAIGIVDSVSNSTGVIFIDMMGPGRSFERYVSRNSSVISSNVRPGTVWEIHRNGHIAIGCSVDESEYGWNTVKLRDNSPSIRFIDTNNSNNTFDIGVIKQSWGEEIYFKKGNIGAKFWIDSSNNIHLSGITGGIDNGLIVNQDISANWDNCLKLKRSDGKIYGLGIDVNERLRHYYSDGNANLYDNGKQGSLIQETSYGTNRPSLDESWTDYGYMFYDTNINKLIIWTENGWKDCNGQSV